MGNPGMVIAGIDGMNGQSVTVNALPVGNSMCPAGGAQLVGGDGGSVVVCSGTAGRASIYGSGAAGPLNLTADTDWSTNPPASFEFTNVLIASGVTLTVPSGVTILATGTFTNLGTIEVQSWGGGGNAQFIDEPLPDGGAGPVVLAVSVEPARGISTRAAQNGYATRGRLGTVNPPGGVAITPTAARNFVRITEEGGGGGGSACVDGTCQGGEGGGSFSIRAAGATQAGAIHANGKPGSQDCSAGGGGGVVVLVSGTSITVGAVAARGGNGNSNAFGSACAGSGGGGGGFVHLIAPQIGPTTTVDVSGEMGTIYGFTPAPLTASGSSGGASGGNGGSGAPVGTMIFSGGFGSTGLVLRTQTDPAALF